MVNAYIFKVDHRKIQHAIQSAVALSKWGDNPEFIVMSADTQTILRKENAESYCCFLGDIEELKIDYCAEYMGIPIAINNSLELGEIKII